MRFFTILFLMLALSVDAATYYIDWDSGNDANAGTSTGAPWKRNPYMVGFTGSYTHVNGDQFIHKGGVTWPASCFTMILDDDHASGSYGLIGATNTWYTGGSFTQPVFDGEGAVVPSAYASGRKSMIQQTGDYWQIDNIKIYNWGIQMGDTELIGAYSAVSPYSVTGSITANCTLGPWVVLSLKTYKSGGVAAYNSTDVTVTNCFIQGPTFIDPSYVTDPNYNGSGAGTSRCTTVVDNEISHVSQCVFAPTSLVEGNIIHDVGASNWSSEHENVIYCFGSSVTVRNNLIYDVVGGTVIYLCPVWNGASGTHLVYNNIAFNTGVYSINIEEETNVSAANGTVRIFNNTVEGILYTQRSGIPPINTVDIRNNLILDRTIFNVDNTIANLTQANNLETTTATAESNGMLEANLFRPTSSWASTADQGADVSAYVTDDYLGTARPQNSVFDIGAYEYVASGGDVTAPVISSIVATPTGTTTADVSFVTDEAATSGLEVGTSTGTYTLSFTNATPTITSHSITATGLSAGTLYYYIVTAEDGSGNFAQSSEGTFTTDSSNPVIFITPSQLAWVIRTNTYAESTIVVSNAGSGTLSGTASTSSPFSLPSVTSYSLASGTTTNITVRYTPTATGQSTDLVTFTGGGGAEASLDGIGFIPQSASSVVATNATLLTPAALSWSTLSDYIYIASEELSPESSARAIFGFEVTSAGFYKIVSQVDAPSGGANSFHFQLDGQPTGTSNIWDIVTVTTGFESRDVTQRGNGSFDTPQFNPQVYYFDADDHYIDVRGREANTLLRSFALESVFSAATGSGTRTGDGSNAAGGAVGVGF